MQQRRARESHLVAYLQREQQNVARDSAAHPFGDVLRFRSSANHPTGGGFAVSGEDLRYVSQRYEECLFLHHLQLINKDVELQ